MTAWRATLLLLLTPALVQAQDRLALSGPGSAPVELTLDSLRRLPQEEVVARIHDSPEQRFAGPSLATVLALSGTPTDRVRGKALRLVVVAEARDGYAVVYSLGELSPALTGRRAIIALSKDGAALDQEEGPLRIIVEGDHYPARWIRQLKSLAIVEAAPR